MKKLYHGTIADIYKIDLNEGKGYKDFGKGFYTTAVKNHADRIAKRNKRIAISRQNTISEKVKGYKKRNFTAYRYNLEFDDSCLTNRDLNIKVFNEADIDWIRFILRNRQCNYTFHDYDIVIGPTADENTVVIINNYQAELQKTNYSDVTLRKLIEELRPENLPKQYFFGTEKSLTYLKFGSIRRERVG